MRRINLPLSALVLSVTVACADDPVAPPIQQSGPGWMSAWAEGEPFNSNFVEVHRNGDHLVLEGTMWVGLDDMLIIRLTMRTDVLGSQVIGSSSMVTAEVKWRPWYTDPKNWTANGSDMSGSATLTTLTSDRATGTFSFTAQALSSSTTPFKYQVTRGNFDVRLR